MLSEISCEHFKQKKISFKSGLNVILGDDKGINSIGKSTALMVVDFVFGGNSFLDHNAGAVREYGAHSYEFCFIFENLNYYFSRNTLSPDEVSICDQNYKLIKNISIDAYTALLKDKYKLIGSVGSFRSLVNTYARIWGKSNYDIVKPLSSFPKQADAIAVTNLIDLFEHLSSILDAKTKAEKEIERFKILRKSIKLEFIPKVTKTQHKENIQKIVEIDLELQKIKEGFSHALTAYEALFNDKLFAMKMSRTQLLKNKEYSQNRINRLKHDVALSNENTKANFSLITEFFPAANIDKISEIENFHKKIGVILKREFEAEILTVVEQIDFFNVELDRIDSNIQNLLSQQGTPSDIFEKVFEIKQRSETAKQQNELYETEVKMASDVKTVKENLQAMQLEILESIAKKLNLGMRELTTKIFDNARQSPTISFATSNKYVFESPSDTGAGKSYINLICLDLSVLSFSKLPVIVHDSILFKNTEPSAFSKLVDIYDTFEKQIFISIDEGSKYGVKALNTLRKNLALEIDGENLLYTRDWRTKN